jgi:four helix bundle protein
MVIRSFEEIIAWQKAKELNLLIYKNFKYCKDYSFCDQTQRAGVYIISNIAKGSEKRCNKEFKNFLYISKGSSSKVRSLTVEISKLLSDFKNFTNIITL